MNKKQRALKRIARDKQIKAEKRLKHPELYAYENFDNIFTYEALYKNVKVCNKNVGWKHSVQYFNNHAITKIDKIMQTFNAGLYPRLLTSSQIYIRERGNLRRITPINFQDRVQQRTLNERALLPAIIPKLIYDNGASLKGKGTSFTRERFEGFLRKAINKWGRNFYILKFDFKSYFDSVPHKTIYEELSKVISDQRTIDYTMEIIKSYARIDQSYAELKHENKEKFYDDLENLRLCGMSLGSEVSQDLAVLIPNKLDHFVKEKAHMKFYTRYMDDGIVIAQTKEELQELLEQMKIIAAELGLTLHPKKTQIIKATKCFEFLQRRYFVDSNKRLVIRISRNTITRERRKLKKFKHLVDEGKMGLEDVKASLTCWLSHCKGTKSYHAQKNMIKYYKELFEAC